MKFRITPQKHDGGYKWWLEKCGDDDRYWYNVGSYTWKWQAKRMAKHLATEPEEFSY
jgi:hypothetical protein